MSVFDASEAGAGLDAGGALGFGAGGAGRGGALAGLASVLGAGGGAALGGGGGAAAGAGGLTGGGGWGGVSSLWPPGPIGGPSCQSSGGNSMPQTFWASLSWTPIS